MEKQRKTIIIGGVAGGASCAARLRRLDKNRKIIILEKGNYISYANCGLPYHVSSVIPNQNDLLLMTPKIMWDRFRIEVRVLNEVIKINRKNRTLIISDIEKGENYEESYDDLVIATGSSPIRPNIEGINSDKIKTIWTVSDTVKIKAIAENQDVKDVLVIGGGFIGLEMAENLRHLNLNVSLAEASPQVMGPIDFEMAQIVHESIRNNGVNLYLNDGVKSFKEKDNRVIAELQSGIELDVDMVILAIGVKPNSSLAKDAGLDINLRGGIIVDSCMKTNDENIYAVGDVIEVQDYIFNEKTMVPLAGPANKQGRIAADQLAGRNSTYKGTQSSSVAKVFDLTVASTGVNEKTLIKRGLVKAKDYESLIITQNSHASYYPGATKMTIKILFSLNDGKILGGQIVGADGVDKRIDTLGVAIRYGGKILDLKDLELAYAPPYSSAKDPINMAGFVAENILTGLIKIAPYDVVSTDKDAYLLDVREKIEVMAYSISNAHNIPLGTLRDHLDEIDKEKRIIVFCAIGVRAYTAARILMQSGFKNVEVYPGGVGFYKVNYPKNNK